MLVLSRKADEAFEATLNGVVIMNVVVLSVEGNKVKLGIEAPQEVRIARDNANPPPQPEPTAA